MAKATKGTAAPKAAPATVAPATVAPAAPTANPLAGMAAQLTAAPAAPATAAPKVHVVNVNGNAVQAANHVATGGKRVVPQGGATYQLTGVPYQNKAGTAHINHYQWQAVLAALAANNGQPVTVAQVAAQYPQHCGTNVHPSKAPAFVVYRTKGAKANLVQVTA